MPIVTLLRWLTLAAVLFWIVVYWQGGRKAVNDIQKSVTTAASRLDTALMVTILLFSLVITGTGLFVSLNLWQMGQLENQAAATGGCLLSISGIVGMFSCRHYLGRFWTAETSLRQGHQVVDKGPYGVVRHPIYTFAILMYLGLGLVFPVWWNLLSAAIIVTAYVLKAWDEDRFLERSLPGYQAYQQHVHYRLVPGVW